MIKVFKIINEVYDANITTGMLELRANCGTKDNSKQLFKTFARSIV